jgi:hypothetical protein
MHTLWGDEVPQPNTHGFVPQQHLFCILLQIARSTGIPGRPSVCQVRNAVLLAEPEAIVHSARHTRNLPRNRIPVHSIRH